MTDNEIFEAVKQRFTDPKVMDLLRAGLAAPEEMEDVKRAIRYGEASMKNPILRDKLYKIFDRLLNVVKDDSTTRQMVKQDLRKIQQGDSAMSEDMNTANVEKAVKHDCAKHVVHEQWGKGQCIAGEHTLLDDGTVTHYDVMFEHGIEQDVPVADLTVLVSESHMHAKRKKAMEEEAVAPAGGEDSSKASKKGKPEMPLEKLKAIMEKKKSEAYKAMLRSQGKMEEETELDEKKLTKPEMKKREEVAKAIERDNPGMPMGKKMAIATATAKKVAEAKAHTVPKTSKEKDLAALAAPHDKITHADVMVGRGVGKKKIQEVTSMKNKTLREFIEQLTESLSPKALGDHLEKHTRLSSTYEIHYWEGPMKYEDQHPDDKAKLDKHIPAAKEHGSHVYRVDGGHELMVHHKGGISALSARNKVTHFPHSEEGKKQLDRHLKKMRMEPDKE